MATLKPWRVYLLNKDGSVYAFDDHTDEVLAVLQGEAFLRFGGSGYRVEHLTVKA